MGIRQDQYERLQALAEKLTDVFLDEADSDNWPGKGILPNAMEASTRGDRYWCKKNAVATVSLIQRVHTLTGLIQVASQGGAGAAGVDDTPEESSLDKEVADAEKEANKLMDQVLKKAAKREFDKRTHGKT